MGIKSFEFNLFFRLFIFFYGFSAIGLVYGAGNNSGEEERQASSRQLQDVEHFENPEMCMLGNRLLSLLNDSGRMLNSDDARTLAKCGFYSDQQSIKCYSCKNIVPLNQLSNNSNMMQMHTRECYHLQEIVQAEEPDNKKMESCYDRINSCKEVGYLRKDSRHHDITPQTLAKAGFYRNAEGKLQCFFCGVKLHDVPKRTPMNDHVRLSPNCSYVALLKQSDEILAIENRYNKCSHVKEGMHGRATQGEENILGGAFNKDIYQMHSNSQQKRSDSFEPVGAMLSSDQLKKLALAGFCLTIQEGDQQVHCKCCDAKIYIKEIMALPNFDPVLFHKDHYLLHHQSCSFVTQVMPNIYEGREVKAINEPSAVMVKTIIKKELIHACYQEEIVQKQLDKLTCSELSLDLRELKRTVRLMCLRDIADSGTNDGYSKSQILHAIDQMIQDHARLDPISMTGELVTLYGVKKEPLIKKEFPSCSVCLDKTVDVMLAQCGHCCCHECADRLTQCPLCRANIDYTCQLFF